MLGWKNIFMNNTNQALRTAQFKKIHYELILRYAIFSNYLLANLYSSVSSGKSGVSEVLYTVIFIVMHQNKAK